MENHVKINILASSPEFKPSRANIGDAGYDCKACIEEKIVLQPGQRALVPLGFRIQLPIGKEAQIRPRSGLAHKQGISIVNSPGTIDSGYIGEVKANVINQGADTFEIAPGDRICQMVIADYYVPIWEDVESLQETERGEGGHGSTGK